jgi:WD40 repeat protein
VSAVDLRIRFLDGWDPITVSCPDGAAWGAVATTPDGTWLAAARTDGRIAMIDAQGSLRGLVAAPRPVHCLAVTPDGRLLAVADAEQILVLSADGTDRRELRSGAHDVHRLQVSPDGRWVVAVDGPVLHVLGLDGTVRSVPAPLVPSDLAVGADGRWIAVTDDRAIRMWRVDGHELGALHGHSGDVARLASNRDGRTLASVGHDGTLRLWDVSRAAAETAAPAAPDAWSVVTADAGAEVLSVGSDGRIHRWRAAEPPEPVQPANPAGWTTLGPDARTYATSMRGLGTSSGSGELEIRDLDGTRHHVTVPGGIRHVAISRGPVVVVAISWDGTVRGWIPDGRQVIAFSSGIKNATGVAVPPDGRAVAVPGNGLRLHHADGTLIVDLGARNVRTASFAEDGVWLATVGPDPEVLVVGRDGAVWSSLGTAAKMVACHAGKALVATAYLDTVAVHDRDTGRRLAALRLGARCHDLCWLPDGSGLVVGGDAGVYVLDLHLDSGP